MSGLLLSQETISTALKMIMDVVREVVPESSGAGVTLIDHQGRRTSAAATDEIVARADTLQYELDEGPCLTAWAEQTMVVVDDTATDLRFPQWSPAADAMGLRSCLSTPLAAGGVALGAMKVYGEEPGVFQESAQRRLSMLSSPAAVLVANMQAYEQAQELTQNLHQAMSNRDMIGMAKGILMAPGGVTQERAFAMLAAASQRQNRKLHGIAQDIVEATIARSDKAATPDDSPG